MVIAIIMQERIKIGGLCHVAIDVSDLERSIKFYTEMFTMDIASRWDKMVQLKTPGGDDSFFLFKADSPANPRGCGMGHFHFGFRINNHDFDNAMEYIKRNNITIHPNPDREAGRFVYIEDPDGYVIQLEPREEGKCGG